MVTGGAAVGVWCEEVEEEGAPAVRACRRSRFVAQYRAHPLQSSFPVRVRGFSQVSADRSTTSSRSVAHGVRRLDWSGCMNGPVHPEQYIVL